MAGHSNLAFQELRGKAAIFLYSGQTFIEFVGLATADEYLQYPHQQ